MRFAALGTLCLLFPFASPPLTASAQAQEATATAAVTPAWDELKTKYANDNKVPTVTEEARDDADYRLSHLVFTNAKGEKVTGLFLRPKKDGVYPVALLLHGYNSDKETMIKFFGRPLAAKGVACLALDAFQQGERKADSADGPGGTAFLSILRKSVADWRQGINYVATRKDVDTKRIGVFGYSMGAMMGSILAAVDERVKAAALCVGGDFTVPMVARASASSRLELASACPSLYIGHIAPRPVLLVNAKDDKTVTKDASDRLQSAAKEPKTILLVEGGHIISGPDAEKARIWLAEKLK